MPGPTYLQPHAVVDAVPQQVAFAEGWQHDTCSIGGQHVATTGASLFPWSSCLRRGAFSSRCSVGIFGRCLFIVRTLSLSFHEHAMCVHLERRTLPGKDAPLVTYHAAPPRCATIEAVRTCSLRSCHVCFGLRKRVIAPFFRTRNHGNAKSGQEECDSTQPECRLIVMKHVVEPPCREWP